MKCTARSFYWPRVSGYAVCLVCCSWVSRRSTFRNRVWSSALGRLLSWSRNSSSVQFYEVYGECGGRSCWNASFVVGIIKTINVHVGRIILDLSGMKLSGYNIFVLNAGQFHGWLAGTPNFCLIAPRSPSFRVPPLIRHHRNRIPD